MKLKLKDTKVVPPCGWKYAVMWGSKTHLVRGTSFSNLFNGLELHSIKNNYSLPNIADFEDMLCRSALTFDPEWDGVQNESGETVLGKDITRRLPIEVWGPPIWGYLHTFGVVWSESQWESAIVRVLFLLASKDAGCEECSRHFWEFTDRYSPRKVKREDEAAVWSWAAHNASKKEQMTYSDAALEWGWNPLQPEEVSAILRDLHSR